MKKNNTKKLIFFKKSLLENDTMQEINLFEPVPSGPKGAKFRALGWHDGEIPAFENLQGFVDPSHKRRIIPTDESFHAIFNT
ncbi:MAG: hypothetical protein EBR94_01235 [Bacteroidetes bacterium]|nr:hypothetical protein [Bacteroidota bacterium]